MESSLFKAVREGDVEAVENLIKQVPDIDVKDSNENTPLNVAAHYENVRIIEMLVDAGADVNTRNNFGFTPLHRAVLDSDTFIEAYYLITRGAEITAKDNRGITPIRYCVATSDGRQFLEYMARAGTQVRILEDGVNLLKTVIRYMTNGRACVVEWLLKNEAHLHSGNPYGIPFPQNIMAIYSMDRDTIELFWKYGCDVNVLYMDNTNVLDDIKYTASIVLLEHIAILQELEKELNPRLLGTISNKNVFKNYFEQCKRELKMARVKKLPNCWVTFWNLLIDGDRKLAMYAGNQNIIQDFYSMHWIVDFPIYGRAMVENFSRALDNRRSRNEASVVLSQCLPTFDPTHLIIHDVLNQFDFEDFKILTERF